LEVRKAPYSPNTPYLVHVPKSLHAAEGAQRRFFEKEAIAQAYVKRLAKMLGEYQLQALGLDDEQKVEAARCYRLLEKYDAGLLTAVQHYIAYLEQANTSASLGKLFETFMAAKKQDGICAGGTGKDNTPTPSTVTFGMGTSRMPLTKKSPGRLTSESKDSRACKS
jgi:hypothetical protein